VTTVYLGIGSNKNPTFYLNSALNALQESFGNLAFSPVYESESVGFKGTNFYNLVVQIQTDLPVNSLSEKLRGIENANGRDRAAPKFSSRTLDIDILLYGDLVGNFAGVQLPRDEILENAFVLRPLFDLCPELIHPQLNKNIAELWAAYDQTKQKLWPVDFFWADRQISHKA
jgi:2-amino-4-hydroxy-6-hydroxymethyldihydropteridine diphosphokinase